MRTLLAVLLLATVATAHFPDHAAVSCIGATGGYLTLAKVCRVEPRVAAGVAFGSMALGGVAWETYWWSRGREFGWKDLVSNAAGLALAAIAVACVK